MSDDDGMSLAESDPTVRAQELGASMRELREEAGLTVRAAGARVDLSASTISKEIAALLAVYGVTGPKRAKLSIRHNRFGTSLS